MKNKGGKWTEDRRETVMVTTYTKDGKIAEGVHPGKEGILVMRLSYRYTPEGDRVQAVEFSGFSLELPNVTYFPAYAQGIRTRFKYDSDGNRIEEANYKNGKKGALLGRVSTTYDSRGKKRQQTVFDGQGRAIGNLVFNYDEKGHVSAVSEFTSGSSLKKREAYTYELDEIGNWIKRTTSRPVARDGELTRFEPAEVTYRTISYYY